MSEHDPRRIIELAVRDSERSYAALSRMIGRPPGFLGKYVREGIPRDLTDFERDILAYALNLRCGALYEREPAATN